MSGHEYIFFIILYNILKIAELDCCQIILSSIYVPSTHAYTHVLCLSLIIEAPFNKVWMWSGGLGRWT